MEKQIVKYTVITSKKFEKNFKKLPPDIQRLAKKELEKLETNPKRGEPLKYDLIGFYSLHFHRNKYRIIYTIKDNTVEILALSIGKRDDNFYKNLKKELFD